VTRAVSGIVLATALAAGGACSGDDATSPPKETVRIDSVSVLASPTNVLAASVRVAAEHADSARVLFVAPGGAPDSTPSVALAEGRAWVPVLGLRSGVAYRGVAEVSGTSGRVQSDSVSFAGGELPDVLRSVVVSTTGTASRGLTLTSHLLGPNTLFAFAFDSSGAIRWYRAFGLPTTYSGGDVQQQPNGHFTIYVGASTGAQPVPGYYVEFGPSGDSLRTFTAPTPLYTDNHELRISGSGADERIHLFGYDRRLVDLSSVGGPSEAQISGHSVVRLLADGTPEFTWSGWDHFGFDDWIEPPGADPQSVEQNDFDHPNALDVDQDGNYVVSWRSLGEVTKIDSRTGEVIWRLGGANNQFTFVNDPLGGFSAQHYARVLPDGHLLLYDNGTRHQPQETRVVEYALDPAAHTATLVWEFRHDPPIYTAFVGSVQRLANGNTAIGYGLAGHMAEVTPDGSVVWEGDLRANGQLLTVYRMVRIASLYRFEVP
jgi:hypothetical protein